MSSAWIVAVHKIFQGVKGGSAWILALSQNTSVFQHSHSHVTPPSDKTVLQLPLTVGHGCSSAHSGIRAGFGGFWEPFLQPGQSLAGPSPGAELEIFISTRKKKQETTKGEEGRAQHLLFLPWHQVPESPVTPEAQDPSWPQFRAGKFLPSTKSRQHLYSVKWIVQRNFSDLLECANYRLEGCYTFNDFVYQMCVYK